MEKKLYLRERYLHKLRPRFLFLSTPSAANGMA